MRKRWIMGIGYLYVVLPIVIFFMGWVKLWISIPICLSLCYFLKKIISQDVELYLPVWNRANIVRGIIIFLVILIWVYFSGIGNFVWQNADHKVRNAFYEMLVFNKWPVIKSFEINEEIQTRGLVYYIGYWLPAAVIGKIFGLKAGYFFQYLWAVLGIFIGAVFVSSFLKHWRIWPIILFIFFSGLDAIGWMLCYHDINIVASLSCMEWWAGYPLFQFSSFTTQLYFVFNQAIYAWVLLALLMTQKNNRYIICIWSLGVLSCTFPFVGMMPFVVYIILKNARVAEEGLKAKEIRELVTIENILGCIIGIISALYLIGNVSVQKSTVSVVTAVNTGQIENGTINMAKRALFIVVGVGLYYLYTHWYFKKKWAFYISLAFLLICFLIRIGTGGGFCMRESMAKWVLFIVVEVGIYYLYIYRYFKKKWVFYISLAFLLICPWIRIGTGGDFCMRASIPALIILYYMVAQSLKTDMERKNILCICGLLVVLVIGGITAVHEMGRSIYNTIQQYQDYGEISNPVNTEETMFLGRNFSGQTENNIFFNFIAK